MNAKTVTIKRHPFIQNIDFALNTIINLAIKGQKAQKTRHKKNMVFTFFRARLNAQYHH